MGAPRGARLPPLSTAGVPTRAPRQRELQSRWREHRRILSRAAVDRLRRSTRRARRTTSAAGGPSVRRRRRARRAAAARVSAARVPDAPRVRTPPKATRSLDRRAEFLGARRGRLASRSQGRGGCAAAILPHGWAARGSSCTSARAGPAAGARAASSSRSQAFRKARKARPHCAEPAVAVGTKHVHFLIHRRYIGRRPPTARRAHAAGRGEVASRRCAMAVGRSRDRSTSTSASAASTHPERRTVVSAVDGSTARAASAAAAGDGAAPHRARCV